MIGVDGGRAFPNPAPNHAERGMTLRDYFAAQAMTALIRGNDWPREQVADVAYRMADAMLAERSKP